MPCAGADRELEERLWLFTPAQMMPCFASTGPPGQSTIRQLITAMPNKFALPLEVQLRHSHQYANDD